MRRALRLAGRGWGRVHPNPMVGAVIVRDGDVIGEGWHRDFGGPHAEVDALAAAGPRARGATMYVSLEPCAHHGKTPPCTDAILAAGIDRVVYAASDPDPVAAGGGAVLREAGIAVEGGLEARAARRQNAAFFHWHERDTPFILLKLALSLDGGIAAAAGERTRITGTEAQLATHRLRAGFDAILVGSGTVRADDPLLTVRGPSMPRVPPARVVLASRAGVPPDSRLMRSVDAAPVHVVHGPEASAERLRQLKRAGAVLHAVPAGAGGVDVHAALASLRAAGIRSILAEGGAALAATLLSEDLVQQLHTFIAPRVLGPRALRGLAEPLPGTWQLVRTRRCGRDALLVFDRVRED